MSQWAGVWIGLWEGDWKGETGLELEELHGGVTQPVTRKRYTGGRRDLDALERAQEAREQAARRKEELAAQKAAKAAERAAVKVAAKPEPVTLANLIPEDTVAALRLAVAENKRLAREQAKLAAAQALADAIALQEQQDDEAAQAFMAFLLAA